MTDKKKIKLIKWKIGKRLRVLCKSIRRENNIFSFKNKGKFKITVIIFTILVLQFSIDN